MKKISKKGNVGGLPNFAMGIVLIGLVVGVGLLVLSEFQNASTSSAVNTSLTTTVTAVGGVANWLSIIVIVVIASVIIGLFGMRGFGGGAR